MAGRNTVHIDMHKMRQRFESIERRDSDELLIKDDFVHQTDDVFTAMLREILNSRKVTVEDLRKAMARFYGNDPAKARADFQNCKRQLVDKANPVTSAFFQKIIVILGLVPIQMSLTLGSPNEQGGLDKSKHEISFLDDPDEPTDNNK